MASIGAAFSEKAPDRLYHEGTGNKMKRIDLAERRKKLLEQRQKEQNNDVQKD
jgi:hypothetical protein